MTVMQTVVETRHYAARAGKFLTESERDALINFVAFAPLRAISWSVPVAFARFGSPGVAEAKAGVCG
jgi:hypothetical protein